MNIIINPGSGPVEGSTAEHALANLEALCRDITAQAPEHPARVESPDLEDQLDGRFRGHIVVSGERIEIDMPGLPLEKVRWRDPLDGDIWGFPRLYVDGSSWIWKFAINICISTANGEDEDEEV